MKILKYIFLLLLLAFIALSVYVATQKGDFDITRSQVIKSPKTVVFNYVNDYRNWENWSAWKQDDPEMRFTYPNTTIGTGASYSWTGKEGMGSMKTLFVKDNDSIVQKMTKNNSYSDVYWSFKDTVGGTKVIWRTKGTVPFMFKIYSLTKGGINKIIGDLYERSLANLNKTLDYEINTYNIKVNGIVTKTSTFYLQQTINSKISNFQMNMKIMLSKLNYFVNKNNIPTNGKPFIIYQSYDVVNGITNFSVCIPIKEKIFTSPGSEISGGKLESFQALKTTLTGDYYTHSRKAWIQAAEYIYKNNLTRNPIGPSMEILTNGIAQEKSPSKWITEIYIAINPKVVITEPKAVPTLQKSPIIESESTEL